MKNQTLKQCLFVLVISCLMTSMAIAVSQRPETTSAKQMNESKQTICTEPRPLVCTMDYTPVCADKKDGSRKTYSNDCTACSDPKVIGYREGKCIQEKTGVNE